MVTRCTNPRYICSHVAGTPSLDGFLLADTECAMELDLCSPILMYNSQRLTNQAGVEHVMYMNHGLLPAVDAGPDLNQCCGRSKAVSG